MSNACIISEHENESNIESVEEEESNESIVDPRVQVELERLNTATDRINKLEIELDEARSNFRLLLRESSLRVNELAKKLGYCVENARPYYEARIYAKQLHCQTQKAALRYERASSAHSAAKEMVYLAEESLKKEGKCFDPAWQEMLNHATLRVNEAESERVISQHEHQKTSLAYNESEKIVQQLHQELKKSIVKSSLSTRRSLLQLNNLANQHQLQLLPYFEMKSQFNQLLEDQRRKVHIIEENVLKMKMSYADALHNLEEISDEIHQQRKSQEKQNSPERSDSVGGESSSSVWDRVKPSFQLKNTSLSTENIYLEQLTTEDTYMSLPLKMNLTSEIVAASCMATNSDTGFLKSLEHHSFQTESSMEGSSCNASSNTLQNVSTICKDKKNVIQSKVKSASSNIGSNSNKQVKRPFLSNENIEDVNKMVEFHDALTKIKENSGSEFPATDFNILGVQCEEISDLESLASNDTKDSLDDEQIECLFLEKVEQLDIEKSHKGSSFLANKFKKLSF